MTSPIRIHDLALGDRPRERLAALGAEALKSEELIAILLRTGTKGMSALDAAAQLLNKFRTLDQLSRASLEEIREVKGIGRDKALALRAAFTLAQRMAKELHQDSPVLDTPERVAGLLREDHRNHKVEHFRIVLLNTRRFRHWQRGAWGA